MLGQVPTADQLRLVQQTSNPPALSSTPGLNHSVALPTQVPPVKAPTSIYIGGGMPPIPAKLAKRIQEGQFIEIAELLPDFLRGPNPSDEDQLKSSKIRTWAITNIIDWIQCFSVYIAIICHSQPERIVDLLGYQNLIITSHQCFPDFN